MSSATTSLCLFTVLPLGVHLARLDACAVTMPAESCSQKHFLWLGALTSELLSFRGAKKGGGIAGKLRLGNQAPSEPGFRTQ